MNKETCTSSPGISAAQRASARRLRSLAWSAQAAMLWLFWRFSGMLGAGRASRFGSALFSWLGPQLEKQKFVHNNLRLAFPGLDEHQRESLAREVWANFGAVLAEYPHLHRFSTTATSPVAFETEISETTRAIMEARKPAVYITAHLANWELAAAAITAAGIPLSVVYAPQRNPLTERLLQRARRALGCQFIVKKNALRKLNRAIRSGRSIGILPDQRVDSGKPVTFFGHDALTTTSPAWLAISTSCPLIPVQIERIAAARYRVTFHKPMNHAAKPGQGGDVLGMTAAINRMFESWIRHQPGQWLCMRRRWPALLSQPPAGRPG